MLLEFYLRREPLMPSTVEIRETHLGKGVFAIQRLRENQLVGTIGGSIVDDPNHGSSYCFDLDNGASLEPNPPFCYVNHSCEANCEIEFYDDDIDDDASKDELAHRSVIIIALRDIEVGEEVTIAYNWPASNTMRCECRAPTCCGWIVDPEDAHNVIADEEVEVP